MAEEATALRQAKSFVLAQLPSSRYNRHAAGILLGSGTQGSALLHALCANPACDMDAELECSCGLVSYCSAKCRIFHAKVHCKDCTLKAPPPLKPRAPMSSGSSSPGGKWAIFIWGNVPSISLVNPAKKSLLPEDELRLCFAASGDLRDVFTTLASIPDDYSAKVSILINDFNSQIVVRNFLMLELLRLHGYDAIDAVIGLWYSSAMTDPQSLVVQAAAFDAMERSGYLDRLARTVAEARILSDETRHPLRAPFARGRSTLTINMFDSTWGLMFRLLLANASLRPDEVVAVQTRGRIDILHSHLQHLWYLPSHMTARRAFNCETGLMLPFSMMRAGLQFGVGNQFLLYPSKFIRPGQRVDFDWPQHPFADPLSGWEIKDVIEAGKRHGVPSNDLYGALFFHVRDVIAAAVRTLERCEVEIDMRHTDARKLTKEISTKFHAISTSNIADLNFVGFTNVLEDWGRGHLVAKGGTLVILSMLWFVSNPEDAWQYNVNDFLEAIGIRGEKDAVKVVRRALEKCVPKLGGAESLTVSNPVPPFFMRMDLVFRKSMERLGVFAAARRLGLRPRKEHQLVPRRIGVPVEAEQGAYPAEFATAEDLLHHSILNLECYTEWEVDKPKNK